MTAAATETNISKRVAPGGWAALYFAILSIAVWTPSLFQNGYVLLGDMVFTPAMHSPVSLLGPVRGTMDVALVYNLAWLVSRVIGAVLLQKGVLFLIAFLPGYLMYRNVPATRQWSRIFAGTLYAVNPFIYTRMVMGQWGFLLGYSLLPVVFASTVKTMRKPTAGRLGTTALWLAGTAVLSLHAGALGLMVAAAVVVFEMARRPRAARTAAAALVLLVLFAMLSSFWLLPAAGNGGPGGAMTRADLKLFETRSTSRAGTALSVASLYGFWKTQIDGLMPRRYIPLWPAFGILMTAFCLYGLFRYRSEPGRGPGLLALAALAVVAFFLSLGARAPLTGGLFSFMFDHVAAFRLFREPQKFVALIVLAYAVLGASGLDRLLRRRSAAPPRQQRRTSLLIPVLLLALISIYSFRMFGGLWGQAKAVSYPKSWASAQEYLDKDSGDWYALYLPSFWYMRYDFTKSDYTITNPMPFYFKNRSLPLLSIEVGPVRLDRTELDDYVQAALSSGRDNGNMGAMLAPLNVKYVLMSRNDASVLFRYVDQQKDLKVVRRWKDLVLLRNAVPVNRLTLVRAAGSYQSWEAVGRQARGAVLSGSYLTRGLKTVLGDTAGTPVPTDVSSERSIRATVPAAPPGDALQTGVSIAAANKVLLLSEPYSSHWRISGQARSSPQLQLGVAIAFGLDPATAAREISISYFYLLLWLGYALSCAALLLCFALALYDRYSNRHERKAAVT
jgi:hypothetical protein